MARNQNRKNQQLRPVTISRGFVQNAEGSALIELGETKVLVTASIEEKIPVWMKEQGIAGGWITAEYGMLPRATLTRSHREKVARAGRTFEIQRLIGRALRSAVDLKALGERTITLDCDVLQADGGTRTAAISGAMVALLDALNVLIEDGKLKKLPLKTMVAAVSVGIIGGEIRLDLDYREDSQAEVDVNVAMTEAGELIEVQGTAEKGNFSRAQLEAMLDLAQKGIKEMIKIQKKVLSV